jgi:hypothetical protein
MMIDIDAWISESEVIREAPRAVRAWNHIQDKPTAVTFKKPDGTVLAAQTVRLESDNGVSENESAAGTSPTRKLVVFGVINHPDSDVADTNMAEGYRFVYLNDEYRIVDIIRTLGELQGIAEVTG